MSKLASWPIARRAPDAAVPPLTVEGPAPQSRRSTARLAGALVLTGYLIAAVALTWRLWADPASRQVSGNPGDVDLFTWYLRYAATAVQHGQLPALVTTALNAPQGVNVMWNTSVLLPGMLLAPVTLLFGPQVSLTVLSTVAIAGSAAALYWVLHRWRVSRPAAALAGALYGFSPALMPTTAGHLHLQLEILPPLIIDAALRLAIRPGPAASAADQPGRRPPVVPAAPRTWPLLRDGIWLGVLVTAQVFISEEIVLVTALAGVLLVVALAASRPRLAAATLGRATAGLVIAAVVTGALAGLALWTQFAGPLTGHGVEFKPDRYVNDLIGFVTPSASMLFHTAGSAAVAAGYQGGAPEYLAYLGWPLIAALGVVVILAWRWPAVRATAVAFVVLEVLSLGGHPLINGTEHYSVSLPWRWIEEHALLASVLPNRLSIVADGLAAALLAFGIDAIRARRPARRSALVLAAAILACLPLIPRPLQAETTDPVPAGWSQTMAQLRLPAGARVLIVPVPLVVLPVAMRWQAESGQPGAIIGGYFNGPGTNGRASLDGTGPRPSARYLNQLWAAGLPPGDPFRADASLAGLATSSASGPAKLRQGPGAAQVRADFGYWRPAAVVAVTTPGTPLGRYLIRLLGKPAIQFGEVIAWRGASLR